MDISKPTQWHIAVGNLNLDISLSLSRFPSKDDVVFASDSWMGVGGAATNYAIAVARMGHKVSLVARTGIEAVNLGILDKLEAVGVDTRWVEVVDSEPMGVVVVLLIPSESSRTMITIRGANRGLRGSSVPFDVGDHVHLSSVRHHVVEEVASRVEGRKVSYDPGGEAIRDPEGVKRALSLVDTVFLNSKELQALTGGTTLEYARSIISGNLKMVVVKQGMGGAFLVRRDEVIVVDPPRGIEVVDVTGAGDAFDAAFNIWFNAGATLEDSLRAAVAAGAAKVGRRGSSNMPTLDEVYSYVNLVPRPRKL